jgi:hypothetical protein
MAHRKQSSRTTVVEMLSEKWIDRVENQSPHEHNRVCQRRFTPVWITNEVMLWRSE